MAEEITAEQVIKKMDQVTREWVDRDLEKGVVLPFRYLKGGRYKIFLIFAIWKNITVPMVLGLIVFFFAINREWIVFGISLGLYILYWIIGILIQKRGQGNFIIKTDGVTIATNGKKVLVPWEAIKDFDYSKETFDPSKNKRPGAYRLVIQTLTRDYEFYEIYAKSLIMDSNGQVNPAMMSLHVAYKLLVAAKQKMDIVKS